MSNRSSKQKPDLDILFPLPKLGFTRGSRCVAIHSGEISLTTFMDAYLNDQQPVSEDELIASPYAVSMAVQSNDLIPFMVDWGWATPHMMQLRDTHIPSWYQPKLVVTITDERKKFLLLQASFWMPTRSRHMAVPTLRFNV